MRSVPNEGGRKLPCAIRALCPGSPLANSGYRRADPAAGDFLFAPFQKFEPTFETGFLAVVIRSPPAQYCPYRHRHRPSLPTTRCRAAALAGGRSAVLPLAWIELRGVARAPVEAGGIQP